MNIILFLSVYGHPFIKTPNMDKMAKDGTVFINAYCPSPLCLPSHSAFISGKRVHEIQTYINCNLNLNREYISFGRVLNEQGVYSVYIEKTDVYDKGENLGFTEMIMPKDREIPGDLNFIRVPLTIRKGAAKRANGYGAKEDAFKNDTLIVDTAVEWITSKASNIKQPWVLVVCITNPHFPQWNTKEFWDMYPEGDLSWYGRECETAKHPYAEDLRKHFETDFFTEEQIRGLRRGYLGCVSYVDQQLGRIMAAVEQIGQSDNTNIIYTSDHGDMLGKFGMWWKCSLYEDSVRIPCIAVGPDFNKGKIILTPVDLHDVQASIFKSVGAERPDDWEGMPLQDIPYNDKDRVVFSEYHGHGTRSGAYMIRKGQWKLIYYMEGPNQLFNLEDDPDELNNIYEKYPQKSAELETELRKICSPEKENHKAHDFQKRQYEALKRHINA